MEVRKLVCLRTAKVWSTPGKAHAAGWLPCLVSTPTEALNLIEKQHPRVGLVLLDGFVDGESGGPELEALLCRTHGDMEWIGLLRPELVDSPAVRTLLLKYLYDYHTLPVDAARLLASLGHAHGMASLRRVEHRIRGAVVGGQGCMLLGESPAMQRVFSQLEKLAAVDSSVMLRGESGTGKELAARLIFERSSRAGAPFVAVNCGAIPANLIQSELFGHEKGAFTGACRRQIGHVEAAHGGVLFLDEIGDLPLELQVNLLRFLQEKVITRVGGTEPVAVDVRIITASHRDLREEVRQGHFREDLFYRLCVLDLELPPLRERREDIELLACYYLRKFAPIINPQVRGFSARALEQMRAYHWPGNVRELKNRVERALVMCEQRVITPRDLELESVCPPGALPTLAEARAEAEQRVMQQALHASDNNILVAARQLGVSRVTLYRLLDKYRQPTA